MMGKQTQSSLYLGLMLVVGGILVFLDINGLLPGHTISIYMNGILAGALFILYVQKRAMWQLMLGTFFLANGGFMFLERVMVIRGPVRIFGIIGIMFFVAYFKSRQIGYLIPGALLFSWSAYFFAISMGIIDGFVSGAGMWILAQSLAFGIIYLFSKANWAKIVGTITGIIGVIICSFGLNVAERYVLLNIVTIGSIILGLVMIVSYLFQNKDHRGK